MEKVMHLDWLKSTKKNQLAYIDSRKTLTAQIDMPEELQRLCKAHHIEIGHSRFVRLKCDYLKLVNEQLTKAGEEPLTTAQSLPYGEWEIEGVLINHNGTKYLRCYPYEGELQAHYYSTYIDGSLHDHLDEAYRLVFEWRNYFRPRKAVCYNVRVDNISILTLCDKQGAADTDIVWYN